MIRFWKRYSIVAVAVVTADLAVWAQGPPLRRHVVIAKRPLDLITATQQPPSTAITTPDLSHLEDIGFTDLLTGGGSAACSRLDWIEVYGRLNP